MLSSFATRDWLLLGLLVVVAILSHLSWLSPFGVNSFADWAYWPPASVNDIPHAWGGWVEYFDFGNPNSMAFFSPVKVLWWIGAELGISPAWMQRLTILIPTAIAPFLTMFLLIRRLGGGSFAAFAAALFYGSTTYLLSRHIGGHLLVSFAYGLAPLFVLNLVHAINSQSRSAWIMLGVASAILALLEVRIFIIIASTSAIVVLVAFRHILREKLALITLAVTVFLCLSAYWILPALLGSNEEIKATMYRGVFGDHLFDMAHALALSDSAWTGGTPNYEFQKQPILLFEWLSPVLALLGLVIGLRAQDPRISKVAIIAAGIAAVGIFLTKQSVPPFSSAYEWLYGNVPGFALYREASKFYLLTAFGYAALIAVAISVLGSMSNRTTRIGALLVSACTILLAILNLWPLLNGKAGGTLVARPIPEEVSRLHAFLDRDPAFGRVLWLPGVGRWRYFTAKHPEVSASSAARALGIDISEDPRRACQTLASTPKFGEELAALGIKYIVVPQPLDGEKADDPFTYYDTRTKCVKAIERGDGIRRLNVVIDQIDVFEVSAEVAMGWMRDSQKETSPMPLTQDRITRLSSGIFRIELPHTSSQAILDISMAYSGGWRVIHGQAGLLQMAVHEVQRLFGADQGRIHIEMFPTSAGMTRLVMGSEWTGQTMTIYAPVQVYFLIGAGLSFFVICLIVLTTGLSLIHKNSKPREKYKWQ